MKKNIVFVPFAFDEKMKSGSNIKAKGIQIKHTYLMNVCVALASCKYYNKDITVAFISNRIFEELDDFYQDILRKNEIEFIYVPFDRFRFCNAYPWSLAFYKLCALSYIVEMEYDNICYVDSDVYFQMNLDNIWKECDSHILLYDVNDGLSDPNYKQFIDEIYKFTEDQKFITHYGGEFFAANRKFSIDYIEICTNIYQLMIKEQFLTKAGDEFIISISADIFKLKIKSANAYINRYWTGGGHRNVSTNYSIDPVCILHLPDEKERGLIKLFKRFISKNVIPKRKVVWNICHLNSLPFIDCVKRLVRRNRNFELG